MKLFENPYLTFENGEIKTKHCMACGQMIAAMDEVPSSKYPGQIVYRMKHFPNFRTKRVDLANGTVTDILMCQDCVKEVDPRDYADSVSKQVKDVFVAEAEAYGRDARAIKEAKDRVKDFKVLDRKQSEKKAKEAKNARRI